MTTYGITARVKIPFGKALARTREALEEEDFVIITEIDLKEQLARKLGKEIRPYTILGIWLPSWEHQALSSEPEIGLLMPSHLCLWDNGDGTSSLATADLKHLLEMEDKPSLVEVAKVVHAKLQAVIDLVWASTLVEQPNDTKNEGRRRNARRPA